ncbi:MAG: DUF131 domain-containing protein [Candidatus Bathyarchaeia archaeon]
MNMAQLGIALMFIGFILIFSALILWFLSSFRGRPRGGGIVMIGPFPLIFGTDKESLKVLLLLAIVLMLVMAVLMVMPVIFWRF